MLGFFKKAALAATTVRRVRRMVKDYPEKFARYNETLQARSLPELVQVTDTGHEFNPAYRLHDWGLVFPHWVQFQITYCSSPPLKLPDQFLFPVSEIV